MNKDLFHVVRPMPIVGVIFVAGKLRVIPANTLQVISLRATGAKHANGAKYGDVVYERVIR